MSRPLNTSDRDSTNNAETEGNATSASSTIDDKASGVSSIADSIMTAHNLEAATTAVCASTESAGENKKAPVSASKFEDNSASPQSTHVKSPSKSPICKSPSPKKVIGLPGGAENKEIDIQSVIPNIDFKSKIKDEFEREIKSSQSTPTVSRHLASPSKLPLGKSPSPKKVIDLHGVAHTSEIDMQSAKPNIDCESKVKDESERQFKSPQRSQIKSPQSFPTLSLLLKSPPKLTLDKSPSPKKVIGLQGAAHISEIDMQSAKPNFDCESKVKDESERQFKSPHRSPIKSPSKSILGKRPSSRTETNLGGAAHISEIDMQSAKLNFDCESKIKDELERQSKSPQRSPIKSPSKSPLCESPSPKKVIGLPGGAENKEIDIRSAIPNIDFESKIKDELERQNKSPQRSPIKSPQRSPIKSPQRSPIKSSQGSPILSRLLNSPSKLTLDKSPSPKKVIGLHGAAHVSEIDMQSAKPNFDCESKVKDESERQFKSPQRSQIKSPSKSILGKRPSSRTETNLVGAAHISEIDMQSAKPNFDCESKVKDESERRFKSPQRSPIKSPSKSILGKRPSSRTETNLGGAADDSE